ncbi:MAG TPA: AraC family transcriptional regulator [Clostridiales bacterium]|nr:AraC family transcriptional regulator [Clostridiales bacterium]HPP35491.1 AraC family transcriptional regulator [Clostridiales bacterium]
MPTMILVEDESFERASLKNCIDWDMIGVRIIGEAENGSQGLAMVMNLHPDIVLTDVKMPVMNGIEMARQIRKLAPEQQIVEEIERIISTQYSSPLTIESIAKMLHFTPNYIGTVFKLVKKISINRYLTNVRIEKAEELLRDNNYSINDIAIMCGYNDITYFHTIFKKETGITPSEYRRRYANR